MSTTPQTEAERLCKEIRTTMRERAGNTVMLPLSHACDIHTELRRLDSLCDERGANEARMLMRCTEMQNQIDQLLAQADQVAALAVAKEIESRKAAQLENADLKERLARSGIDLRRAVAAEREECAKWYAEKGWLLDEEDVPAAIRAQGVE